MAKRRQPMTTQEMGERALALLRARIAAGKGRARQMGVQERTYWQLLAPDGKVPLFCTPQEPNIKARWHHDGTPDDVCRNCGFKNTDRY